MKKLLLIMLSVSLLTSCGDGSKSKRIVSASSGNINNLQVIIDSELWLSRIGDELREVFSAEVVGLPQQEPLFSIRQMPPVVFTGFATKNRTILKIEMGNEASISFNNNIYAQPQKVITISGKTKDDIMKLVSENSSRILETFKGIEIYEKQRLIKKSLYNTKEIQENLGLNINFPTAYRVTKTIATKEDKFYWMKRDIPTGYVNILLYELPLKSINRDSSLITQVIKIRDSIGKKYIGGPIDGSYMITENAYTPFHNETILDNKPTLETKGMWDVKNAVMAGPFVNFAIEDKINNRWIIAEGFVYAPSVEKRNYMFELEAIIKSIKID